MPKFTIIGEHIDLYGTPDGTKVTYEFQVDTLDNVLEHVDLFIRGCGYNPSGTLDYVPDETYYGLDPEYGDHGGGSLPEDYPELYESMDIPSTKSQHYFDTERNK
jgi:hypothetical protein